MPYANLDISGEMKDPSVSDWFHACMCSWVSDIESMEQRGYLPPDCSLCKCQLKNSAYVHVCTLCRHSLCVFLILNHTMVFCRNCHCCYKWTLITLQQIKESREMTGDILIFEVFLCVCVCEPVLTNLFLLRYIFLFISRSSPLTFYLPPPCCREVCYYVQT